MTTINLRYSNGGEQLMFLIDFANNFWSLFRPLVCGNIKINDLIICMYLLLKIVACCRNCMFSYMLRTWHHTYENMICWHPMSCRICIYSGVDCPFNFTVSFTSRQKIHKLSIARERAQAHMDSPHEIGRVLANDLSFN